MLLHSATTIMSACCYIILMECVKMDKQLNIHQDVRIV